MLVTMQNSELVNKLVIVAGGDIDLVQKAIRTVASSDDGAELKAVVQYIITHRPQRVMRAPSARVGERAA